MSTNYESTGKRKKSKLESIFEKIESGATSLRHAVMPDKVQSDAQKTIDYMDKKRKTMPKK